MITLRILRAQMSRVETAPKGLRATLMLQLAEAAKRETELRQKIQRLAAENSALTAELQAARTAAAAAS